MISDKDIFVLFTFDPNFKTTSMKNLFLIFALSMLLQSCYTYKKMDLQKAPVVEGEYYKVRQNERFSKVKIVKANAETLTVIENHESRTISVSNIKEIKSRKFSALKTFLVAPAVYGAGIVILFVGLSL